MAQEIARPLATVVQEVTAAFTEKFGRAPTCIAAAPGRVNLIGEHIDYCDGFVLPMAIDRYTVVAADLADHGSVKIGSTLIEEIGTLNLEGKPEEGQPSWTKYANGVLKVYNEAGMTSPAFDAMIDSTVPLGSGLSSSAALEVGIATAIESLGQFDVDPKQKALNCQKAEHIAGIPCGVMDQFSSALCDVDNLMLLDCRSLETKSVALTDPSVTVLIINSKVEHELAGGEYAERRQQCEEGVEKLGVASFREAADNGVSVNSLEGVHLQRARHAVDEIIRTQKAADLIPQGEWEELGKLMYASHNSLRDDFEVSCKELDILVELAEAIGLEGGVYGSRMTGGGFGGCTVTLMKSDVAEEVAKKICEAYQAKTGIEPRWFTTRPRAGLISLGDSHH